MTAFITDGATPAVPLSSPPASTSDSSNSSNTQASSGLSQSDKIAIGVGLGVGIPAVIIALIGLFVQIKRRS